jgi:hypothetical protein
VIVLVAIALIGGTFLVATGRGGELARGTSEELAGPDFESWTDVARYRPPPALLGYQPAATDHALHVVSRLIAERDAEIAWLRERLREVQPESGRGSLTGPGEADDT